MVMKMYDDISSTRAKIDELISKARTISNDNGIIARLSTFEAMNDEIEQDFVSILKNLPEVRRECRTLDFSSFHRPPQEFLDRWLQSVENELDYIISILTRASGSPLVSEELLDSQSTTVLVVRTADIEDDTYLKGLLDGMDMTDKNPKSFFTMGEGTILLDTLSIATEYNLFGDLGLKVLVDPLDSHYATDIDIGMEIIGFQKETRLDPHSHTVGKLYNVRKFYNLFDEGPEWFEKERLDYWFNPMEDGSRRFDYFVVFEYRDENPAICAINPDLDWVEGFTTTPCSIADSWMNSCTNSSMFHDIGTWDQIKVWEYVNGSQFSGYLPGETVSVRAYKKEEEVFYSGTWAEQLPENDSVRVKSYTRQDDERWIGFFMLSVPTFESGSSGNACFPHYPLLLIFLKDMPQTSSPTSAPFTDPPTSTDPPTTSSSCKVGAKNMLLQAFIITIVVAVNL
jgi:hypothetical protein